MKLKILLAIETLVLIFFIAFAYIKAGEAENFKHIAERLAEEAVLLTKAAENEAMRAEEMAFHAVRAQNEAEKLLEDCRNSK